MDSIPSEFLRVYSKVAESTYNWINVNSPRSFHLHFTYTDNRIFHIYNLQRSAFLKTYRNNSKRVTQTVITNSCSEFHMTS